MIEQMAIPFLHDSAVASQPCPSGHITADKRLYFTSSKFAYWQTSFIRGTLSDV